MCTYTAAATFDAATYLRIVKQPAVWGLMFTTFFDGLGTPIFLSYLPQVCRLPAHSRPNRHFVCKLVSAITAADSSALRQYLVTQLRFPVGSAAAIASLPLFASFTGNFLSGFLADWLASPAGGKLSTINVRRLIYVGGRSYYFLCGLLLTTDISASTAIFIIVTQSFTDGMNGSGLWCSPFDISREYSGAVMGLINMCGNLTYYAISANLIGYLLDRGKCKLSYDLPQVDAIATFVIPNTNETKFLGVSGDCQSGLQSCVANMEQAVMDDYIDTHEDAFVDPDEKVCKQTWELLFVASGTIALLASFIFAATARGDNMDHIFSGGTIPESAATGDDSSEMTKVSFNLLTPNCGTTTTPLYRFCMVCTFIADSR